PPLAHPLARLPAKPLLVDLHRHLPVGGHQLVPRPFADFRVTFRTLLAARRFDDVERGALRIHHHLHTTHIRYLDHLVLLLATETLDLCHGFFELRHAHVHCPERRRLQLRWLGQDTPDAHITDAIEHGVRLARPLE